MLHRPCTYAGKNTAKIQRVADSRIPQGKSSLMIFDRHANLKYKYGNRHFWCRGYFVDTVGKNTKKIEEYIKKPNNRRYNGRQNEYEGVYRPVYG